MFPGTFFCASGTNKEHPKELRHEALFLNRLFRNAFSEHYKHSEKECDERSLHRVPGACSQVHPLCLQNSKGYPQELEKIDLANFFWGGGGSICEK